MNKILNMNILSSDKDISSNYNQMKLLASLDNVACNGAGASNSNALNMSWYSSQSPNSKAAHGKQLRFNQYSNASKTQICSPRF